MALLKLQYAITQTSRIDNEVRASMPANNFMLRVLRPNDPRSRTMSNLLHHPLDVCSRIVPTTCCRQQRLPERTITHLAKIVVPLREHHPASKGHRRTGAQNRP